MSYNDKFRHVEKCLYSYKDNLARIAALNDDLTILRAGSDVHAQNYQQRLNNSIASANPVASYVEKIQKLENHIIKLKRVTEPVTRLINDIEAAIINSDSNVMRDFNILLNSFYFGRCSLIEVAAIIEKSRKTLSKRRTALVKKAAIYLGF